MVSEDIKRGRNDSRVYQVLHLLGYAVSSRLSAKARRPLVCGFKVTGDCNLNCRHCPFVRDSSRKAASPDYILASDILDRLYADGVRIVIFEGGEPLMWKDPAAGRDISDLIAKAKEKFFYTCITTNGTMPLEGIDPDIVFISIDGLKETHDSIRGKSFDMIMANIGKYRQKKIIVNTCISRSNFMEIPQLVRFLEGKVYGITIQFFYPYQKVENLSLNTVQKKQVLEELISLKRKGFSILDSYSCLKKMQDNSWRCHDFLIASVEPDGTIIHGCYLKERVEKISCAHCGFAAHCEVSMAYDLDFKAIKAARDIFWK